ncbi:MAG: hypothetical protein ACRYFS_21340 [Janthinobacterium lividum]
MIVRKSVATSKKWRMLGLIVQITGCIGLAFGLYMLIGMTYRANVLVSDLSNEFTVNHIVQGCSLPMLMNYLHKRQGNPIKDPNGRAFKDPDGGPYIMAWLGVKDIRLLQDRALVRFKISADEKVESYAFEPTSALPITWSNPRTGL